MLDAFLARLEVLADALRAGFAFGDARQTRRAQLLVCDTGRHIEVGSAAFEAADVLARTPGIPQLPSGALVLEGDTLEARSAAIAYAEAALRQVLPAGGSSEALDLRALAAREASAPVFARMPRGLFRPLGAKTYAVRLTALLAQATNWAKVPHAALLPPDLEAPLFLFSQRSLKKRIGPGLWDSLAAGLVAAGETPEAALARECAEEAGLAFDQATLIALSSRSFVCPIPEGLLFEESFEYALRLAPDFRPRALDGEVAAFGAFSPVETLDLIERGLMMPEAAAAALAVLQKMTAEALQ